MPIGPKISTHIKIKIAETYIQMRKQDSKVTAKEVKKAVQEELPKYNPNLPDDWPGLSAVQKVITDYRKGESEQPPEQKALDQPWRVLDIAKHPIPPEIMPIVLEAWARQMLKNSPLTIREVLWIARLYYVWKDRKSTLPVVLGDGAKTLTPSDDISVVTWCAKRYASDEMLYELTGGYTGKPDDMWWDWAHDANVYFMITEEGKLERHIGKVLRKRGQVWPHFPENMVDESEKRTFGRKEADNERSHSSKG